MAETTKSTEATETASLPALRATAIPDDVLFAHLRLVPKYTAEEDAAFARVCRAAALDHVLSTYGMTPEYADEHESIAVAVLILARDMYDNRTADASGASPNRTLEAILSAHDFNLV